MKKKHIYRVHYDAGYRQITFSKALPEKPFYDMRIYDSNEKAGYDLDISLNKENGVTTTAIYYNILQDRTEAEIHVNMLKLHTDNKAQYVKALLETFKVCGWKCETIQTDIDEFIAYLQNIGK